MAIDPDPRLLDEHEAAAFLRISPKTLQRWRWSGGGPPFVKLGSRVRYARCDLEDFVALRRRFSTADPGPEHQGVL